MEPQNESIDEVKTEEKEPEREKSIKEERIRKIAPFYYSRLDIRKAIFEFSKHRECIPRYFEGFGKRPDAFQYDSDTLELAKKGATSFHCSEELWSDPLEISTSLKEDEMKKLRIGWDLIIDIDSKYLDYSKIAAELIIKVLREHGIKGIGLKFSGSKGFHIIVPFKAFPEEMSGKKTKDMFPDWPRLICQYLKENIKDELNSRIFETSSMRELESKNEIISQKFCPECEKEVSIKKMRTFICTNCKTKIQKMNCTKESLRCFLCSANAKKVSDEEIFFCELCKINPFSSIGTYSRGETPIFKEDSRETTKSHQDSTDIILVSPRHLFRMPYSLHEKTALVSVVVDIDKIKDFELTQANPLKVIPKSFIPDSEEGEAKELLRRAVEFQPPEKKLTESDKDIDTKNLGEKKFKDITIENLTPDLYPPTITKILEGMKTDGRKRALFILLSFFKSLKLSNEQIQKQVEDWNKKNHEPLSPSYVKGQIMWYNKLKEARLPPNFDKPYYKEIGVTPTPEELSMKNPVSYVIRKSFSKNYKNSQKQYARNKKNNIRV